MTTSKLTPPAPLDPRRLYTPTEVDQWRSAWLDYRDAIKAEEAAERLKQQAAEAHENRISTREEAYAEAVKRHAAERAKESARHAAEQAKADAATTYLESSPELAEVTSDNPYHLLVKLEHWIKRGYRVTENSVQFWLPNLQHVVLAAPASTKGGKQ